MLHNARGPRAAAARCASIVREPPRSAGPDEMRPVLSPCVQAGLILAWTCTAARGGPLPPPTAAAYAGEAATAAAAPSAASPAVGALPALNIDTDAITISGISSGADFVVNMQVAHSELIAGVGVFAGQAYHCAVTRFPPDPLRPASSDVPVCDGCPDGMTLGYDHCKQHPEYVDVDLLVEYARNQSALGTIDNVSNLANRQLYFYRGTHDTCYKTGAEEATLSFFARLTGDRGNNKRVAYEGSVGSNHAQPTFSWGAPCGGKGNKTFSYIESCGYDGAGAVLQHMYPNLTRPAVSSSEVSYDSANLVQFDQSAYWVNATHPELKSPNLPADGSAGTAASAYAYIPRRCRKDAGDGSRCKLHIYHHGCGGPWGSVFYEGVSHHGGFNEWAEVNGLVIVYPAMRQWGKTGQSRGGCWDGYAQTGTDYGLRSGAQISVVRNIIRQVAGV